MSYFVVNGRFENWILVVFYDNPAGPDPLPDKPSADQTQSFCKKTICETVVYFLTLSRPVESAIYITVIPIWYKLLWAINYVSKLS